MSEYGNLINKANKKLSQKEERQQQQKDKKRGPALNPNILAAIIIVAVLAINIYVIMPKMTKEQYETDLQTLTKDATNSINQHLKEYGVLPPQIPEPALRPIISYRVVDAQSSPPEYVLEARHADHVYVLNSLSDKS